MVHLYIDSIIAGLLITNGVPHFIKGITGKSFKTPFAKDSTPNVNIIWGWLNFVVGGIFLHYAHPHAHPLRAFAAFALASLVMALVISNTMFETKSKSLG